MNPLDELIQIVKTGTKPEVKQAQKAIEHYWHLNISSKAKRKQVKTNFKIFLQEIGEFGQIADIDHQVAFIGSLKWAFWTLGEEYFDIWVEFVLFCIQHPSGKVRQAILHACDILPMQLTFDVRHIFDNEEKQKFTQEDHLEAVNKFGRFVMAVDFLIQQYYEPRFKRYKYISSLPVSIYKSLQKLFCEVLQRSPYYEDIYNEFLEHQDLLSKDELSKPNLQFLGPKVIKE